MSASAVYPVQVLSDHLSGLEAAVTVCLADPDHKPVHKLRTETRRVEAVLLLLGLVPDLPEHRKAAARMLRCLKKLRRAAGAVRDLDVHRKLLESFADVERTVVEAQGSAADKPGEQSAGDPEDARLPLAEEAPQAASVLSQAAGELRDKLGHERKAAAEALKTVLQRRQVQTAEHAQALLEVLKPAKDVSLSAPDLLKDVEAVLTRDGLLRPGHVKKLNTEELHTVRKAAKKARYLAEALPEDTHLVEAARRFEALQEAGGQWHDALELAQAARRYFGKGHELTVTYREDRDRKLELYRAALTGDREAQAITKRPAKAAAKAAAAKRAGRARVTSARKTPARRTRVTA